MEIGFIGLGHMGQGMARNLLKAGHALTVYNRTRSQALALAAEGARVAETPGDAARGEVVITMVSDDPALEEVTFGPQGILEPMPQGALHLSMSTVSPALSRRLAEAHAQKGQRYLAAPVFGRPDAAAAGKLSIVASGARADFDRAEPLFGVLGQKSFHLSEEPSAANLLKVTGNYMLASLIENLAEAIALFRKSGVDPRAALDILTGTVFTAPAYRNYGENMLSGHFEPGFAVPLALKDVRLVLGAAEAAQVPMPVASLLRDQLLSAIGRGHGDKDWSVLSEFAADNAGL